MGSLHSYALLFTVCMLAFGLLALTPSDLKVVDNIKYHILHNNTSKLETVMFCYVPRRVKKDP